MQRSCEDKNDIFFVVNALRISSHVGANRFVGSIARAVGFAQWICTTICDMHRCTLGLHSPAMDVAFQMQGMPKIASMVSECTLGAVPRQPQARDPRGSRRRRRACAEPRGALGPSLLLRCTVTNQPMRCDTHASLSCLITSATPPPPPLCLYQDTCCYHKTETPLSF